MSLYFLILSHVRESGKFFLVEFGKFRLWNLESQILESEMQLKEFEIPLTIGIRNPKCGIHYRNPESGIHGVEPESKTVLVSFTPVGRINWSLALYI